MGQTIKKTGIDIISKRITRLEKEVIKTTLSLPKNSVCLDLGAGSGFFSIILVFLHQKVYFIDKKIDFKIRILKKIFKLDNLILVKKDIQKMNYKDFPENISVVYSSRFLHYLKYKETEKLLKILKSKLILKKLDKNIINNNGKLFFSISGINSELGNNYLKKKENKNIKNRFDFLSKENQKKFQIKNKVKLYTKKEVKKLFSEYFEIEKIWQSDFGNIFVIAIIK